MHNEYGLIGHPLGHSFSAAFFAQKFKSEGIDATYSNFDLSCIEEVEAMLQAHPQMKGFNVTIPYKQAIIPFLNSLSAEAEEIGAVNVVKVVYDAQGQRTLHGFNSDVIGFCRSIKPLLRTDHKKALVLGTGGASKAVVYGLKRLGVESTLVSRQPSAQHISYADINEDLLQSHTIVVNCSPVGMYPHTDQAPELPYHFINPSHLCYDLVYNPEVTEFMKRCATQGAITKNGLEMLHLQALAAWEVWQV